MDSTRIERLLRLKEAAEAYAKSIEAEVYAKSAEGLIDTTGIGHAKLACMNWEERARGKLLLAIEDYDRG